jgi:hypothetical protein
MARSQVDAPTIAAGGEPRRFVLGIVVPLTIVGLTYVLWWISDRLLYIGPLDRATFGWVVVIPLWLSAPIAAGLVWHRLTPRGSLMAACAVGVALSAVAAVLFWQGVAHPDCGTGTIRTPTDWVLPSMLIGSLIGAGLVASGLLAGAQFRAGRPWRGVLLGGGAELAFVFGAVLAAALTLAGPACQRPSL